MRVDVQRHGYANGHQLLASSIALDKRDQETVNRLSDVSGPIGPGEDFAPYLTGYPLGSDRFVFARTWPDMEARRAGCVRTISLILDGAAWSEFTSPAALIPLLENMPHGRRASLEAASIDARPVILPPTNGPITVALVEALFLEQRKPVVCFQHEDAEILTLRLIEALWPAMRRSFAFCTYALQARTVDSRPFDLLFAPKAARSRYSDWPGRKLERSGGAQSSSARHTWSQDLSDAIFHSPKPDLKLADSLGVLSAGKDGDATALRFAMLWRELAERAEVDPSAALGMLDILSAAQLPASQKVRVARELYERTASRLAGSSEPVAALGQLKLLLTKLPARARHAAIADQTASVAATLVNLAPSAASVLLDLLVADDWAGLGLLEGVSKGLASSGKQAEAIELLTQAKPESLRAMLTIEPKLHPLAMQPAAATAGLYPILALALSDGPAGELQALRESIASLLQLPTHAQLVPALVNGSDAGALARVLTAILCSPGGVDPAIQRALIEALSPRKLPALRTALEAFGPNDPRFDELRQASFAADGSDLDSIADLIQSAPSRGRGLLHAYLGRLSDDAVQRFAMRNPVAARTIVRDFATDGDTLATDAARLLIGSPSIVIGVERELTSLWPKLPARQAQDLVTAVLAPMVRGSDQWQVLRDVLASKAGEAAASAMKASHLIAILVPLQSEAFSASRQSSALSLAVLLPSDHALPQKLIKHISNLAERLSAKPVKDLGDGSLAVWGELLHRANVKRVSDAPSAAAISLSYAMRWPRKATAPLARAAFPIVLWAADQPRSLFDHWGRWMGVDLDNAKEVREAIVGTYLTSEWPISDLLRGAWYVDEASRVIKLLKRSRRGSDALVAAAVELKRASNVPSRLIALTQAELPKRR